MNPTRSLSHCRIILKFCALLLALLIQVKASAREGTEWMTSYWYNASDNKLPRVLLVGDSICNGYQSLVRDELAGVAYVSYLATSKCVTDPTYSRLLSFVLDEYDYKVIHFNNGLHSLSTDPTAWKAGLSSSLDLIKAKGKGAKIIWASSTPLKDPALTEKAKELNRIAAEVVKVNDIPTDDLFALMDPLDRNVFWRDTYHYNDEARKMQARQVANTIREALGAKKATATEAQTALAAAASETGPDGKIAPAQVAPKVIQNQDFEEASGWNIYPPTLQKGKMEYSAENPHSGAKAIKVVVTAPGVQIYQFKPALEAGKDYTLKFWARAESPSHFDAFVRTVKPPYGVYGKITAEVGTDWKEYKTSFTLPANFSAADHGFFFEFQSPGTYWIDDVSFSKP